MSVPAASAPAFRRMAGEAWLRAGQPSAAIAPLEQTSAARTGDARSARSLALAYALTGDAAKGLPALTPYLIGAGAKDGPALAAGVYATLHRPIRAHRRRHHRCRSHPGPHLGPRLRRDQGPACAARGSVGGVSRSDEVTPPGAGF